MATSNPYTKTPIEEKTIEENEKTLIDYLSLPPTRKISDCSTVSSLSGDDYELTDELQPIKRIQVSLLTSRIIQSNKSGHKRK